MTTLALGDNMGILALAARERAGRLARRLRQRSPSGLARRPAPERLLLAPPDLWTADPITAREIYAGRFFLAGVMIDCEGSDPFRMHRAPPSWRRELHAFQWLRHHEAAASPLAGSNAVALIGDWITAFPRPGRAAPDRVAWEEETTARRLIAWIQHSVPVVENATPAFYRKWLRSIAQHIRFLKNVASDAPDGPSRLISHIALSYASICVSDQQVYLRRAFANLGEELARQVLPDGGMSTRNPDHIADILALLLPLRESCIKLGVSPPPDMLTAIDRMMVALKFYRLGNGSTAHFNGVSASRSDLISTILYYDDAMGTAPENAGSSGFQRMAMGSSTLIADTGIPPRGALSLQANAGTLSFEFTSGSSPVVINCGAPLARDSEMTGASRLTAAHSTATLNDMSSSRIYRSGLFANLLAGRIIAGPRKVECRREDKPGYKLFEASHDGYLRQFSVVHHRAIRLQDAGDAIEGTDRFTGANGDQIRSGKPARFDIRFHLHPSVSAGRGEDGKTIVLMCGSGVVWQFSCPDIEPKLEESVFFSGSSGPRRTWQIVLSGEAHAMPQVRWLFRHVQE